MAEPPGVPRKSRRIAVDGVTPPPPPTARRSAATGPRPGPGSPPQVTPPGPSDPSAVSEERICRAQDKAAATLASIASRLAAATEALPGITESSRAEATSRLDAVTTRAAGARAAAVSHAEKQHHARVDAARTGVAEAVSTLAPGPASAAPADLTCTPTGAFASHLRVGSVTAGDVDAPALAPAAGRTHWYLDASFPAALDLVEATVLRLVSQIRLRHLRVQVCDTRIRGALSALTPLRDAEGASFPPALTSASALAHHADTVLATAATNAERTVAGGHRTLAELWSETHHLEGRVEVVVVLGYPYEIDAEADRALVRLADAGPATGVFLVVVEDAAAPPDRDVDPQALRRRMTVLTHRDGRWDVPGLPDGLPVRQDGPVPATTVRSVVDAAVEAARNVPGPVFPLAELIAEDLTRPWSRTSEQSVDALIGKAGRSPLVVSLRTSNPPTPNLLIGGMVGQGKSNLILDLIYSLAVAYPPEELELQLLDFKDGLEFQAFGPDADGRNWLPHATLLCLESSQEFGLAALRDVRDEMYRRAELFKSHAASDLGDLRVRYDTPVPRLVVVVDEFHKLFVGPDQATEDAIALIDDISRTGRAYGIHLVLASQTTSGIPALASRGEAIFSQFALRLSLKNTPAESQNIFEEGNKAAADLTYRGQVVFNRNAGRNDGTSNVIGMSGYVDTDEFRGIQADLWARGVEAGSSAPPRMFFGRDYARWIPGQLAAHLRDHDASDGLHLWLGRPIAVTDTPTTLHVDTDAEQAVALVGDGDAEGRAVLTSMLLSAGGMPHGEVVLLDGHGESLPDWLSPTAEVIRARGTAVTHIGKSAAARWLLSELNPRLDSPDRSRGPLLVVALSPQRIPGMETPQETDEDEFVLDPPTPRSVLAAAAVDGAVEGVFVVGWWNTLRALARDLGFDHTGIGAYIALKIGLEDLRSLAGPFTTAVTESPRATLINRNSDAGPVRFVPFEPAGPLVLEEAR